MPQLFDAPPVAGLDTGPAIAAMARVNVPAGLGQAALHDVSFTVRRGEIVSLLGTGGVGSGIATVLAAFAGFARANSGEVQLGGRLMDTTPTHRRGIGMVGRNLALFSHLDVAGHASFAAGVRPAQADAIVQRLGLAGFARRRPAGLSTEIQFRTALARALASAPKLLLLEDQPGGLQMIAGLKPLLRSIVAETGLAILHATDDASSSYGFSDRIGVMQSGVLRQLGTPQELYDRPETLAAAQAMGALNRLAGTVLDSEDDIVRVRLSGGAVVEARFIEGLQSGDACVVALRPERIAVAAVQAAEMGDGAVPARLLETVFEGSQLRLRFGIEGKAGTASEVMVTRPSNAIMPRGNAMCLAWQPHHAHAFRTEAA